MVKRNPHIIKLNAGYLFPEVNKRKRAYLEKNPNAKLISLGIGDTTEPLYPHMTQSLVKAAQDLGTAQGYSGYGSEQGNLLLRNQIASKLYQNTVSSDEIFVSDGAKCDIGRLQILFGSHTTIAVQNPSYPAYVDTSVILGQTGEYNLEQGNYRGIVYLPCDPKNNFFPDLSSAPRTDLIYFCSPNNPTGAVSTREQLTALVNFAKKNRSILIFDAAYAVYIQDPEIPKSIYEIPGAREVAIELGSFSKMSGYTGVRLGWSIVPEELKYEDGSSVKTDWSRIVSTFFNGASNIAQIGGIGVLDDQGHPEMMKMVNFYLENAQILKNTFLEMGYEVYGGDHSPYLWVKFPGLKSWDAFEYLLEHAEIVTTPGSGFGAEGEGFIRLSAYGHRSTILEAVQRFKSVGVH